MELWRGGGIDRGTARGEETRAKQAHHMARRRETSGGDGFLDWTPVSSNRRRSFRAIMAALVHRARDEERQVDAGHGLSRFIGTRGGLAWHTRPGLVAQSPVRG